MNIWEKLSNLGINENMPLYLKKSIILFNQIIRVLVTLIVITIVLVYFVWDIKPIVVVLLCLLPIFWVSLFLNLRGHVNVALLMLSNTVPIVILTASLYMKIHGITNDIFFLLVPRLMVAVFIILPFAFMGFVNVKKSLWGSITGILVYIFFDKVHTWFGVGVNTMTYKVDYYLMLIFVISIVLIIIIFLFFFLQNINTTYEKIVLGQKHEIETKNESITSSINYASLIQTAILPTEDMIYQSLGEHFILFKPKDIVSGDFYWLRQLDNKIIITAADCTGHGVPGAFMSMLGVSFLNEIVTAENINKASDILNVLRKKVKSSLRQTGKVDEARDGMDIALCIIDINTLRLQYAGAHNPLYIIRNNELILIKGDNMPIGISFKDKESFTNHEFDLNENDRLYMFSDGYKDQFGGADKRKFSSKNFKELLLKIHQKPMLEQKTILIDTLNEWCGDNTQVDDILVIGLKIQGTRRDV